MGGRVVIPDTQVVYSMSATHPPVASAEPGDTVVFSTQDCFSNQVRAEEDLERVSWETVNPATGPLEVRGSRPGDTLIVEILDIEVADRGLMVTLPGMGALAHLLKRQTVRFFPIREGAVIFNDRVRVPLEPMVGVIGTAPGEGEVPCGTPGSHGGNLDTRTIGVGSRVYLPVYVPGALLVLGDLHAAMGDGEVVICGVEVPGRVTVKVDLVRGRTLPSPVVETAEAWMTVASAEDLDRAVALALDHMVTFLRERLPLGLEEIGLLLSCAGHTQVSQVVDPLKTARMLIPKRMLDGYGVSF